MCKTSTLKHVSNQQFRYFSDKLKSMSSQEVSAALRPFYFAVHPDLFWQQPHAKVSYEPLMRVLNKYSL